MAGDMLRAEEQDWAVEALAELLAHAQRHASSSTARLLEPIAMAPPTRPEGPARIAGSTSRKRPRTRAARSARRRAWPERRGWLLRLSGDEDGARQAFERALSARARRRRAGAPLLRARPLGRRTVPRGGRPVGAVELCDAHRWDRRGAVVGARDHRRAHPHGAAAAVGLGRVRLAGGDVPRRGADDGRGAAVAPRDARARGPVAWRSSAASARSGGAEGVRAAGARRRRPRRRALDAAYGTFGDGLELEFGSGTLELWYGEECFARREGYRGLGEELAAAEELLSAAHVATILELLHDADRVIDAENELSLASEQTRATFERLRDEAKACGRSGGARTRPPLARRRGRSPALLPGRRRARGRPRTARRPAVDRGRARRGTGRVPRGARAGA